MAYNAFACKDTPAVDSFTTEALSRLIVKGVLFTRSVAHIIVQRPNQQHTTQVGSSRRRHPRIEKLSLVVIHARSPTEC